MYSDMHVEMTTPLLTSAPPDPPDLPHNDGTIMEDAAVQKLPFKDILADQPKKLNQYYNSTILTRGKELSSDGTSI